MQNHYFDTLHPLRPYTHSLEANPNSLPPENALRGNAPEIIPGFWPCEKNGKWVQVEDHRKDDGQERADRQGYMNGEPYTIKDIGPLPEGWSEDPPPPTPEDQAAQRKVEIMDRMFALDMESIRPLRAVADGIATDFDREKLDAIEAEVAALRAELSGLAS
ncbi:MAG: hypothetical protein FWF99_00030 [Desulfovibrionaceae bacterium]|nr:hypothetical protein [Desulfovibrionaceae bacterium]